MGKHLARHKKLGHLSTGSVERYLKRSVPLYTVEVHRNRVEGLDLGGGSGYDYLVESVGGGESKENQPLFISLSLTNCFLSKKFFINYLTNRKHNTGILATGCRLTTSSSIQGIQLLPMIVSCPVVTHLVLSTKTRVAYHSVSKHFYRFIL